MGCSPGTYLNLTTFVCQNCTANCVSCQNNGTCLQCVNANFTLTAGACPPVAQPDLIPTNSSSGTVLEDFHTSQRSLSLKVPFFVLLMFAGCLAGHYSTVFVFYSLIDVVQMISQLRYVQVLFSPALYGFYDVLSFSANLEFLPELIGQNTNLMRSKGGFWQNSRDAVFLKNSSSFLFTACLFLAAYGFLVLSRRLLASSHQLAVTLRLYCV